MALALEHARHARPNRFASLGEHLPAIDRNLPADVLHQVPHEPDIITRRPLS